MVTFLGGAFIFQDCKKYYASGNVVPVGVDVSGRPDLWKFGK